MKTEFGTAPALCEGCLQLQSSTFNWMRSWTWRRWARGVARLFEGRRQPAFAPTTLGLQNEPTVTLDPMRSILALSQWPCSAMGNCGLGGLAWSNVPYVCRIMAKLTRGGGQTFDGEALSSGQRLDDELSPTSRMNPRPGTICPCCGRSKFDVDVLRRRFSKVGETIGLLVWLRLPARSCG